jgi:hypothetical protein
LFDNSIFWLPYNDVLLFFSLAWSWKK